MIPRSARATAFVPSTRDMEKGKPVPLELGNNDGTDRKSSCAPLIPSVVFLSPGTQNPLSISPSTKTQTHCLIAAVPNIFNIK